jgi:signal transduction histidine kinase
MAASTFHERLGRDRVRARILFPFTFVILFVILAFLISAYLYEDREHEKNLARNVAAVERLFHRVLKSDANKMRMALAMIARNKEVKKAFMTKDRNALLALAMPLFANLQKENSITHFYFTDRERVNFLRVHKPNRYGDVINRVTTLRAAKTLLPSSGIELGPLGTFTLRVVFPWYDKGRLIGFLELGEGIDRIINEVHAILGTGLLVLVKERYLNYERWKTGRKMLGHQADWGRFGSGVVVGRAMGKIPGALVRVLEQGDFIPDGVLHLVQGGRVLYVAFLPFIDILRREVGKIIVVRDVTASQTGFHNAMALILVVTIFVGGGVFVIFYKILGRVERDYRRQRDIELQLSRVNNQHQKVIQLEKLSAMGLAIGEIAHQLNSPLVGVVNMAQLALRKTDEPERITKLLEEIAKAGKDCHAFVKRMLAFIKITSFERRPMDIKILIKETVVLFRQSSSSSPVVDIKFPDVAPILNVDPVLIRHALFNLLSNAEQANRPGGKIFVSLYRQKDKLDKTRGWCISVQDEGQGLSKDVQAKLFTPFFTTRSEGTGLGLPVAQHIAILHEGEITAENSENGGAVFAFWLPDTHTD